MNVNYGKSILDFCAPNLPAVYIKSAKSSFELAKKIHTESIKIYQGTAGKITFSEEETVKLYDYLAHIQVAIIMICVAIECVVNTILPQNYIFKEKGREYDYFEIQRYISLEKKLKDIIPVSLSIPQLSNQPFWSKIKCLIKVRNDLVHMKSAETNTVADQRMYFDQKDKDVVSRLIQDNTISYIQSGFDLVSFFFEHLKAKFDFPVWLDTENLDIQEVDDIMNHYSLVSRK